MLDVDPRSRDAGVVPHGAVEQHGRRDADRAEHADGLVHPHRDEGPGADGPAVGGRGDQRDLRDGGLAHVAEAHRLAGFQPQPPHLVAQPGVGLKFGDRFVSGAAQAARGHHHDRHAIVHAGHRDAVEDVADMPGGQHAPAALPVFGEGQHDRRRRTWHPVNRGIPVVADRPAPHRKARRREAAGVDHPYPDRRTRRQAPFDRERADPGEQVAAVLPAGNRGLVDTDLQEQVIDVRIRPNGAGDHRHLGGQRVRAADPVDLPGVRAPHDPQQQIIPFSRIRRQVRREEVRPLRRPAPHQHAPHPAVTRPPRNLSLTINLTPTAPESVDVAT